MITIEHVLKSGMTNKDVFNLDYIISDPILRKRVFYYEYPIDEDYRESFEKQFLRRFYFRNLCDQNVGRWAVMLSARLNSIFPYYNDILRNIGDYALLQGNYKDTDTYNRTTSSNYNTTEEGNARNERTNTASNNTTSTLSTESDSTGSTSASGSNSDTSNNFDFPDSTIGTEGAYQTSKNTASNSSNSNGSSQGHNEGSSTGTTSNTANSTDTIVSGNSKSGSNTGTTTENSTRIITHDSNINKLDYFIKYKDEITKVYENIFNELDDLFLALL